MAQESRRSARVNTKVPVRLRSGSLGVTRDVSPNGVYFEVSEKITPGSMLHFTIDFDDPSGGLLELECTGTVVRVDEGDGKVGVAVSIADSRLRRPGAGGMRRAALESQARTKEASQRR